MKNAYLAPKRPAPKQGGAPQTTPKCKYLKRNFPMHNGEGKCCMGAWGFRKSPLCKHVFCLRSPVGRSTTTPTTTKVWWWGVVDTGLGGLHECTGYIIQWWATLTSRWDGLSQYMCKKLFQFFFTLRTLPCCTGVALREPKSVKNAHKFVFISDINSQ